jgi:hypothetical protein
MASARLCSLGSDIGPMTRIGGRERIAGDTRIVTDSLARPAIAAATIIPKTSVQRVTSVSP